MSFCVVALLIVFGGLFAVFILFVAPFVRELISPLLLLIVLVSGHSGDFAAGDFIDLYPLAR